MARHRLTTAVVVRYRLLHWSVKVIIVFALSRIITTALLLWYAGRQGPNAWTGAAPSYLDFATLWDGTWYYIISVAGYPSELPLTADGHVGESAWAFMPVYPAIVRVLTPPGVPFSAVAVVVSIACALGAALVFYRLMVRFLPSSTALFAVVLWCVAPLSPVYQIAYAESMYLFLLALALLLLVDRRYGWLVPVIAVMALTRPSGLAFALTMLLHVVYRWWRARRGEEEFPTRERVAAVLVGLFSAVMGFAWLVIAGLVTGRPAAYLETELAWRAAYIGYEELVPFTPWFRAAVWWAQWWGLPPWLLVIALVLIVALCGVLLFIGPVRRLGPDIRFWLASYSLYLLAVFFPQSSTFRLLMPLFPALGALAQPRSRVYRVSLVALFVLGQWAWIHVAWWVDGYDWTPP